MTAPRDQPRSAAGPDVCAGLLSAATGAGAHAELGASKPAGGVWRWAPWLCENVSAADLPLGVGLDPAVGVRGR
ncbi:MAG: hypothetical protein M3070_05355 [Actinomycetota bacterium]|nr:hypothetical protein [Actinomycetota bacterium]